MRKVTSLVAVGFIIIRLDSSEMGAERGGGWERLGRRGCAAGGARGWAMPACFSFYVSETLYWL